MRFPWVIRPWMLLLVATLSAWGQTTGSAAASNQSPYNMQVNSRVVLTDVTVTDHQGNAVTGLSEGDFQLFDNGKPQKLASFDEHHQKASPLSVNTSLPDQFSNDYVRNPPPQINVLLFDTTTIGIVDQMYLFQQMKRLVDDLPLGDPVAVYARVSSGTIQLASFTADHVILLAAIRKAIPRLSQPGSWMASDLDTLLQIGLQLRRIPGRKNLLWFTGGSNLLLRSDPMTVAMDDSARRAIYDMLESERIAIYPIDARGLPVTFGRAALAVASQQIQMRQDAEATGGAAYYNNNALAQVARHVLSGDGNFYTLSYMPDNLKNNNKWHRVEVKLVNAHYQLSYRQGYFDDGINQQQPTKEVKIRTALRDGGNKVEVPNDQDEPIVFSVRVVLRSVSAPPLPGDTTPKKGQTRYVVEYSVPANEVYTGSLHNSVGSAALGTAAFIYDRNGKLVSRSAFKFALKINEQTVKRSPNAKVSVAQPVNLPTGSNFLYLGVWDMSTGRLGTVNATVDVMKPKG